MLKRISVSDVELGMFVHKLEGSWFKHPFWKSRFLLQDSGMLDDLHASDIDAVVIDISKGYDVRPLPAQPKSSIPPRTGLHPARAPLRSRAQSILTPAPQAPDFRSTAPNSMAREFGLAKQVAGKSRKVISRAFLESRLGKSIKASYVEPVIEDIFCSIQRNPHAFNGLMRCKRDNDYIYRHALAVSALMISLGRQMKLPAETIRLAGMSGLLMDVGIGMLPVDLSRYGGDYRNLDPKVLNQHIMLGYEFLEAGGGISAAVLDVVLNHHELMDGTGYPNRLPGDRIDLLSRMAAICDGYDSMVSDTADGSGMDPASSLQQMTMMKGWYDPDILARFVETLGVYPIGSVVLLRSDRLAMVVAQDPSDYTRPRVRPFFTNLTGKFIKADEIAFASCYGNDEIVETVEPSDFGIEDFPRIRERLFNNAHKDGD
jgi:HD-GYP domain-containing protein (c-di-GMP phosphodiesterase class II)